MARYDRAPSTVLVQPIDPSPLYKEVIDFLNEQREGTDKPRVTTVRTGVEWGIVETPRGLYAICTEGVGPSSPVTDERPLEIEFFVTGEERQGEFIAMFPACSTKLIPSKLRKFRTSAAPVPLHEWVRSFGARLEANYSSWQRLLEGIEVAL